MLKERELRYVLADSGAKAIISLPDPWQSTAARAVAGTEVAVAITTDLPKTSTGKLLRRELRQRAAGG
jgi:hypothetical protein